MTMFDIIPARIKYEHNTFYAFTKWEFVELKLQSHYAQY